MGFRGTGNSTVEDSQPCEGKEDHQPRQHYLEQAKQDEISGSGGRFSEDGSLHSWRLSGSLGQRTVSTS